MVWGWHRGTEILVPAAEPTPPIFDYLKVRRFVDRFFERGIPRGQLKQKIETLKKSKQRLISFSAGLFFSSELARLTLELEKK